MTEADNDLRRRSWREIAERDPGRFYGETSVGEWMADAVDALTEAADLLPFTELGELVVRLFDCDPLWWGQHFPIPLIAKIAAAKRNQDLERVLRAERDT